MITMAFRNLLQVLNIHGRLKQILDSLTQYLTKLVSQLSYITVAQVSQPNSCLRGTELGTGKRTSVIVVIGPSDVLKGYFPVAHSKTTRPKLQMSDAKP